MAEIEIVYREGFCEFAMGEYSDFCHSENAEEFPPCMAFDNGKKALQAKHPNRIVFPFGDCVNAKYMYRYKGIVSKKYEIQPDILSDVMHVTIGNQIYVCVKVKLNGKCLFNAFDDEEVQVQTVANG